MISVLDLGYLPVIADVEMHCDGYGLLAVFYWNAEKGYLLFRGGESGVSLSFMEESLSCMPD
jgi:hypothetical protein